jgi:AraC-like DNA-binding protein/tetratricopeptide (TPR) repeat protein
MLYLSRFISVVVLCSADLPLISQNNYNDIIREASIWSVEGKADKADSAGRALLLRYIQNPPENDSVIAKTYFLLGQANFHLGKRNVSLNYYQKALQTSFISSSPSYADACWNNMAFIYHSQSRYDEASKAGYQSLAIAQQLKDSVSIISTWINIGIIATNIGRNDEAIRILKYCQNYWQQHHDREILADVLINLANAYAPVNPTEAERYYTEALSILRQTGNARRISINLINLADFESKRSNYAKSNEILKEAIDLCTKNELLEYLGIAYRYISNNEIDANGNLQLARVYLDQSRVLAEKFDRLDQLNLIKEVELKLSVRSGNYHSFLATLKDYIKSGENISRENAKIIQSEFEAIYEVKNITEQNVLLEKSVLQKKRQLLLSLLALLGSTFAIIIIAYQYRKLKQASTTMFRMNVEIANSTPVVHSSLPGEISEFMEQNANSAENEEELPLFNLYYTILRRLETDKMYLDASLSLQDFCLRINRNQRIVSQAINEVGKTTFPNLVNNFRINEARRLLVSSLDLSVNDIMEKSGFGSRPAFHRNFKAVTGFTPSQYQARAKNTGYSDDDS